MGQALSFENGFMAKSSVMKKILLTLRNTNSLYITFAQSYCGTSRFDTEMFQTSPQRVMLFAVKTQI